MSIRLRLTLLYSTILALTLIIFGVVLYSIQAGDTLNSLKRDLTLGSERFVAEALRAEAPRLPKDILTGETPPPQSFDEFSTEQAFQDVREREVVRLLDANGNLLASPRGRQEDVLPLSQDGLAALQDQQEWWEENTVNDENMLIYNRPIVQDGETVLILQFARSLTERNRTLKSLATTLGGAGLMTILIAFGVGWVMSGFTLQPIDHITQTARAIGEENDFSRRVTYSGPQDEVGQLANTFNQMLTRLHDAHKKVEHSLEMQRGFVADVSHELRTPLTTIRGNLGLLSHEMPTPPEVQADILVDMVDESDRLIRLVNNLLLLARTDAGRTLSKQPLAIQPVLEETVQQAHQLDVQRKITMDVPSEISIPGDRDAFKQVMLILLDNALKHSSGDIEVKANQSGAHVEISIKDQGHGISPEKLGHVFDRFYRDEDRSNAQGFGLGLPIAKVLTEGMGGTITMESEEGLGSKVYLRFETVNSI